MIVSQEVKFKDFLKIPTEYLKQKGRFNYG